MEREQFISRLGFLLTTAGCAIGLGNIWRFPYITGAYGGALFVLIYLFFLAILGFPVMVAELSLGRASRSDLPGAYKVLGPKDRPNHWPVIGHIAFIGNTVLLMFYCVITGWMLQYFWKYLTGGFPSEQNMGAYFGTFLSNWGQMTLFNFIGIAVTVIVCMLGVVKGVEKTVKLMIGGLFLLELILIGRVAFFDGAGAGFKFFLMPSLSSLTNAGLWPVIYAAMAQAFFTLSVGIGSIAICGSYASKTHSLSSDCISVICMDTAAAIMSGLIIFPACFAFNNPPDQGPALIFVTMTKVFQNMSGGRWFGMLFFAFMSLAALSTEIAVGENIIAYFMRIFNITRRMASLLFGVMLAILSLPCVFGFNLLSSFHPLGKGTCVLDLEDFIVSDNLLPLGAAAIVIFCTSKRGWGMENFLTEVNTGKGMRFPKFYYAYMKWVLPVLILGFWSYNLYSKFIR